MGENEPDLFWGRARRCPSRGSRGRDPEGEDCERAAGVGLRVIHTLVAAESDSRIPGENVQFGRTKDRPAIFQNRGAAGRGRVGHDQDTGEAVWGG